MTDKAIKQPEAIKPKRRRVHKRTWVIVFFVVILPWILIGVPGTFSGGGGTSGVNISTMRHGWPFVHLYTTKAYVFGLFRNGKVVPGQASSQTLNKMARDFSEQQETDTNQALELDLRFHRDQEPANWQIIGHWSEARNWPLWGAGRHWSPRYLGLLPNLVLIGLVSYLAIAFCEFRIRRYQRLLNFSLRSMLIATTIIGTLFAWGVYELNEMNETAEVVDALNEWDAAGHIFFHTDRETRFPLVVSQLFNHGKFPGGNTPFFFQVQSGEVQLSLDASTTADVDQIIELAIDSGFSINLDVMDFDTLRQQMLSRFDGANVYELSIDFDSDDWVYHTINDEDQDTDWEEAKKLANLKLNLSINLPNLESLNIDLDSTLDQVDQLEAFKDMQSLNRCSISNLSTSGAEYMLETIDRWPSDTHLDFDDDVPVDVRKKLESKFKPIYHLHTSLVPVVG